MEGKARSTSCLLIRREPFTPHSVPLVLFYCISQITNTVTVTAANEINGPVEEDVFSVISEISFLRGKGRPRDPGL